MFFEYLVITPGMQDFFCHFPSPCRDTRRTGKFPKSWVIFPLAYRPESPARSHPPPPPQRYRVVLAEILISPQPSVVFVSAGYPDPIRTIQRNQANQAFAASGDEVLPDSRRFFHPNGFGPIYRDAGWDGKLPQNSAVRAKRAP